jgi:chemotaxis protein MotB
VPSLPKQSELEKKNMPEASKQKRASNKSDNIRFVWKKEKKHDAHGGAWKVAYADFVTALMAMFIVLWLTSQSNQTKAAISDYFKEPGKYLAERIHKSKIRAMILAKGEEAAEEVVEKENNPRNDIIMAMSKMRNVINNMRMDILEDGIRIEMSDTSEVALFEKGKAIITVESENRLRESFGKLGRISYPMVIEGHTDVSSDAGGNGYSNWELGMDRANAVRRLIEDMKVAKVTEVKSFGSTRLVNLAFPESPENRRVTILVKLPKSQFF